MNPSAAPMSEIHALHPSMPPLSSSSTSSSSSPWEPSWCSLPDDVALKITSLLNATELCSIGSCSRHLRDVCASDFFWANLAKSRWPSIDLHTEAPAVGETEPAVPAWKAYPDPHKRWKDIYVRRHRDIADGVSTAIAFVTRQYDSRNESLPVGDYHKAAADLASVGPGFEDVKTLLFAAENDVLVNLLGLHHAVFGLGVPVEEVDEALRRRGIREREVCVMSFTLGRLFFGFRLPDKCYSHRVSLGELASVDNEQIRGILNRGAIHQMPQADLARSWGKEFLDCVKRG